MDDNENNLKIKDKILCIKLPAKVNSEERAIQSMGGIYNIFEKYKKDEDIDLDILLKKIPLEKCFSNDLLIKKKRYRSKKNPDIKKHTYEISGKIETQYEFFALHDFMFLTEEKNDLESTLESILYINLEDLIKLDTYFSSKENESLEILLNDKIEEIKSKDKKFEFLLQFLQPYSFTYRRHLYPYFMKEIKENLNESDSEK